MTDEITLKEFFDSRIDDIKESVKTAYASMEKRLAGMNEFRDTLKDQAGKFVTREEMDAKIEGVQKDIQALQKIVWTGIGASLALQFLLKFFVQ